VDHPPTDVRTRITHHSPPDVTSCNYDFSLLNGPIREVLENWEKYVLDCAKQSGGENVLSMSARVQKTVLTPRYSPR
jgi:hypothetical protein